MIRYYINEIANQFGHAKTIVLGGVLIVFVIFAWLAIFSTNISLDYQISSFKKEIQKKEDSISLLHEKVFSVISDNKIEEWAKENGFTNVKAMNYLNLSEGNLAQVNSINFK
jgi:cell division protein FtsL